MSAKISELPAATTSDSSVIPGVQDGTTKQFDIDLIRRTQATAQELTDGTGTTPREYSPANIKTMVELHSPTGSLAVTSVHGRTGAVTAATSDYDASQVDFTPAGDIAATTVQAAIEELDTEKSGTSHTHTALVPAGGTTGQILAKDSATDYDLTWADQIAGSGTVYTAFTRTPISRASDTFYTGPQTVQGMVPSGGTTDQVLAKNSASDYDLKWKDDEGAGGGLSNAYSTITDGTTPASASGGDTIKFRSSDSSITLATQSNDATHGDNVNFQTTFGGTGSAATAARSDHNHTGTYAASSHTHTLANVTDWAEKHYTRTFQFYFGSGKPSSSQTLVLMGQPETTLRLASGLDGGTHLVGGATAVATADTDFTVEYSTNSGASWSSAGTVRVAAAGRTPAVQSGFAGNIDIAGANMLRIVAPGTQDATLAGVNIAVKALIQ